MSHSILLQQLYRCGWWNCLAVVSLLHGWSFPEGGATGFLADPLSTLLCYPVGFIALSCCLSWICCWARQFRVCCHQYADATQPCSSSPSEADAALLYWYSAIVMVWMKANKIWRLIRWDMIVAALLGNFVIQISENQPVMDISPPLLPEGCSLYFGHCFESISYVDSLGSAPLTAAAQP